MNNLAAVVAPVVVPYYGGGIDIHLLPTFGIAVLMIVVALLLVLLGVISYGMNKDEFTDRGYGADIETRIMTIVIDILSFMTLCGCVWFYYICIEELISRF